MHLKAAIFTDPGLMKNVHKRIGFLFFLAIHVNFPMIFKVSFLTAHQSIAPFKVYLSSVLHVICPLFLVSNSYGFFFTKIAEISAQNCLTSLLASN